MAGEGEEVGNVARRKIRRLLLAWYRDHRRQLPWRDQDSAYAVWVSEVMLQQTRVEVVRDYFSRWMRAFPTIEDLAHAQEAEVLRSWQGLGYYSRAKRLLSGAKFVMSEFGGELPRHPEELMRVPGIGPYSAGAISSIAFSEPAPLVDGNVIRVLCRLFALSGDPNKAVLKKKLWSLAGQLVSPSQPGDFNQALMELGALVCTPRKPTCLVCPLSAECQALKLGEVARFPELPKPASATALVMVLAMIEKRGRLAVLRLPDEARWWAGLDAFPFKEVGVDQDPATIARELAEEVLPGQNWEPCCPRALPIVKHGVTRYRVQLHPFLFPSAAPLDGSRGAKRSQSTLRWLTPEQARKAALPAPHMKALRGAFFP